MSTNRTSRWAPQLWWHWIIAIDLIFVAATVLPFLVPMPVNLVRLSTYLTLAIENNYGAWWSSLQYFAAAALFWEFADRRLHGLRSVWIVLFLLLAGLSVDELATIHERVSAVGGWRGLAPYGAVIVGMLGYTLVRLYRKPALRRTTVLLAIGFGCFALTAVQEYFEHRMVLGHMLRGIRTGIEEGTELAGIGLILWAAVRYRNAGPWLKRMVADPQRLPGLPLALMAGFVLQYLSAWLIPWNPATWPSRGHPAIWYPVVVYYLLFAWCFRRALYASPAPVRTRYGWLAAAFLVVSADTVRPLHDVIHIFIPRQPAVEWLGHAISWGVPIALLVGVILSARLPRRVTLAAVAGVIVLPWAIHALPVTDALDTLRVGLGASATVGLLALLYADRAIAPRDD